MGKIHLLNRISKENLLYVNYQTCLIMANTTYGLGGKEGSPLEN